MNNIPIYLDSNVIIEICDGRGQGLDKLLIESVDSGKYCYPFSAEQIAEITFGNNVERNKQRLKFISKLSNNTYFTHNVHELGFKHESPFSVYETINEVAPLVEEKELLNLITYQQQVEARKAYGIDSNKLNNLPPKKVIEYLNKTFKNFKHPENVDIKQAPDSVDDLVEFNRKNTIKHFSALWNMMGASQELMLRDNTIITLFSLLDTFGFWADSKKVYAKGSRFGDSRHTFNASFFDGLVSRDKRLLMKSSVVFNYVGIRTKTFHTDEFREHLEGK